MCLRMRSWRRARRGAASVYFGDNEDYPEDGSRRLPLCTSETHNEWEGRGRGVAGDGDSSRSGRREPRGGGRVGGVEEAAVEID